MFATAPKGSWLLADDGKGPYIAQWKLAGVDNPMPGGVPDAALVTLDAQLTSNASVMSGLATTLRTQFAALTPSAQAMFAPIETAVTNLLSVGNLQGAATVLEGLSPQGLIPPSLAANATAAVGAIVSAGAQLQPPVSVT